jgi:hypothetical protein
MSAICLIDTTIFLEILDVPGKAARHEDVIQELQRKMEDEETLFLHMATILETGNHIAQNGDGRQRRACALNFVSQVQDALNGKSPFKPISFLEKEHLQKWLSEFPEYAVQETSLGDLSIIHDFARLCRQSREREIHIWSQDGHLSSIRQQGRY